MFCPVCSQEQASNDARFCSRCGFLLIGVSQLIASGGALPQALQKTQTPKMSERKRGLKQGATLFLSGIVIVPILIIIFTEIIHLGPALPVITAIIAFLGGFLRMIYALFFESKNVEAKDESILPEFIRKNLPSDKQARPLPPAGNIPNANYVPPVNWRDTNDLSAPPPSVTDETTKLFKR
jgi:hypothetical protein